ncbi:MAG: hypothetical protein CBC13_05315 [Planctomycetia bacterium TMED53]|nr:MAG: hypothetical protein CBC13_05315 [Planctomycetia bacterium TMED53]
MPRIVAEKGPDRGRSWSVRSDGTLLVGRDTSAQISLRDEEISRRHCQIEFRDSSWWIRDLESTNGIQINGEVASDRVKLKHNDHIDLGVTRLTFLLEEDPLIGKTLGGCLVIARIGRGGMGTVYQARQISLDRPVALKVLSDKFTRDQSFIDMFIREARAAGLLSHPHIVQVYDVGREGELHYFTMELMDGGSAEKRIDESGALPLYDALDIARQAALGLDYAEKQGIVHRDIKPGNLMMTQGGVVKIGDLGIARKADSSGVVSQKEGVSGSPHYIAPEQARGEAIDQRADIYSLGATLYHCLTGKTPYKGGGAREVILKHMNATEAPDPWMIVPKSLIPADVRSLLQRMMSPDKDRRQENAQRLAQDLDHLMVRYPEGSRNKPPVPLVVAAFLVLLVGGALFFNQDRGEYNDEPSPLQQIQIQISQLKPEVEEIESRVSSSADLAQLLEDLDRIQLAIEKLESKKVEGSENDLKSLRENYQRALRATHLEDERREELELESQARELLADLMMESEVSKNSEDRIPPLEALIAKYPDTRASKMAGQTVENLKSEIAEQKLRNQAAERDWNTLRARAEGWLRSEQPGRARKEVLSLSDQHVDTESWEEREAMLLQIDQQAIDMWRQARVEIRSLLEKNRKAEANDRLNQVISRALIPATTAFEEELRKEISTSQDSTQLPEFSQLSPVLIAGWNKWNDDFSGLEAARVVRASLLENRYSAEDLKTAERHTESFELFDRLLSQQPDVQLEFESKRKILTPTKEISAPFATLKGDRVIFRDSAQGLRRYLLWSELTPQSRLDLWQESAPKGEWADFIALLLEFNQRSAEAAGIWQQQGDSPLKALLSDLKPQSREDR